MQNETVLRCLQHFCAVRPSDRSPIHGLDQVQVSKVVLVQLFDRQEIAALVPDRQVS
jgi:hypothetical protein